MIIEFRAGWLSKHVKDMRNGLMSLKSPEFQRELWLGLKDREGTICHGDVHRWIKNHAWITVNKKS